MIAANTECRSAMGRGPAQAWPAPMPADHAGSNAMAIYGAPIPPPCGFEFMEAIRSPNPWIWLLPCPACVHGRAAVVYGEHGWTLRAENGCSGEGCAPSYILWWHAWRKGEQTPRLPADERAKRYAWSAIRRVMERLPGRCTPAELRAVAQQAGRWVDAADLDPDPVADALIGAAERSGLDVAAMARPLAEAMTRDRAKPARLPA
jgi:hypothetical protein